MERKDGEKRPLFRFRVIYWAQTEGQKRGRTGNKATYFDFYTQPESSHLPMPKLSHLPYPTLSANVEPMSSQYTVPRDSTLHKHDNRLSSH